MNITPLRKGSFVLTALVVLAGGSSLLVPGCGDGGAKSDLRSFEAAIEDLMGEEERVVQRLSDLFEDTKNQNLEGTEYEPYLLDTAAPFYEKFAAKVAATEPKAEGLKDVRERLVDYLDAQVQHVEYMTAFFKANGSDERKQFTTLEVEWKASMNEVVQQSGGQVTNMDVAQLVGNCQSFLQVRYTRFLQGHVPAAEIENDLRQHLLPRLYKAADLSKDNRKADGLKGAVARFAKSSADYFEHMSNTLPTQEALARSAGQGLEVWEAGVSRRAEFMEALAAYRESLR